MAGILDIDDGNTFLTSFLARFNQRFAIPPAKPEDLHRHSISQRAASPISCVTAWAQLTFHNDRKQIILERNEISENLGGQYVELHDFMDRPMEVRWKEFRFPTASSVMTSASATRPSSRTNDSATRSLWSRHSRISGTQPG
jgi:hypothetical protein